MICKEYEHLAPHERQQYIGKLLHSCMSHSKLFLYGQRIIEAAESIGVLDGVEIAPENYSFTPELLEHE